MIKRHLIGAQGNFNVPCLLARVLHFSTLPAPSADDACILDAFYSTRRINNWTQGVRCLDWVTRKDSLALTTQWTKRCNPLVTDVVPACYALPYDRISWEHASVLAHSAWWIAKPVNNSNSDGIRLLSVAEATSEFCRDADHSAQPQAGDTKTIETVLQRYVQKPRTIGGCKFDLRLCVLVLRRGDAPRLRCCTLMASHDSQQSSMLARMIAEAVPLQRLWKRRESTLTALMRHNLTRSHHAHTSRTTRARC
jgi:hypothetical protein